MKRVCTEGTTTKVKRIAYTVPESMISQVRQESTCRMFAMLARATMLTHF